MERVKEMRRKGWEGGKGTPAFFVFARNPLSPPPLQEELSTLPSVLTPNVILLTNEMEEAGFPRPPNAQQWFKVSF